MANLHDLLKYMIEKGASDLHITTGIPPSIRVDGKIKLIPGLEPLSAISDQGPLLQHPHRCPEA